MLADQAHLAAVADRDFIEDLSAALNWWAAQHTWRVSSSHTGGGVIAAFESAVASHIGPGAHALALPSATAALRTALEIAGVGRGDKVGVPALDWTAASAAVRALGARAVPLPADPDTGLLDVAQSIREDSTRDLAAVILVHLHGLTGDAPALRRARPQLFIVEDAAQAWGARYPDGRPVGSAADACAFSFGAAKSPSAGELGCLVTGSAARYRHAVARTQHPTRQLLAGIGSPCDDRLMTRAAPAAALLGAFAIQRHAALTPALRRAAQQMVVSLREAGLTVLTDPTRHAPGVVAVRASPAEVRPLLFSERLPGGLAIDSVDKADVRLYPGCEDKAARAIQEEGITVVTIAASRDQYGSAMERRIAGTTAARDPVTRREEGS